MKKIYKIYVVSQYYEIGIKPECGGPYSRITNIKKLFLRKAYRVYFENGHIQDVYAPINDVWYERQCNILVKTIKKLREKYRLFPDI